MYTFCIVGFLSDITCGKKNKCLYIKVLFVLIKRTYDGGVLLYIDLVYILE